MSQKMLLHLLPTDLNIEILTFLPIEQVLEIHRNKYHELYNVCQNLELWKKLWKRDFSEFLPDNFEGFLTYNTAYHLLTYQSDKYEVFEVSCLNGWEKKVQELFRMDRHNVDFALVAAVRGGHLHIVEYLVSKGANIRRNDDNALSIAAEHGRLDVVKYLVEKGADIHSCKDHAFRDSCKQGHLNVVRYLSENGANVHAADDWGLRFSCLNGHLNVVKYLIEKEANIHINNDEPLLNAIITDHLEIVKYLIEKGANVNGINVGQMQLLEKKGHNEMLEYLKPKLSFKYEKLSLINNVDPFDFFIIKSSSQMPYISFN